MIRSQLSGASDQGPVITSPRRRVEYAIRPRAGPAVLLALPRRSEARGNGERWARGPRVSGGFAGTWTVRDGVGAADASNGLPRAVQGAGRGEGRPADRAPERCDRSRRPGRHLRLGPAPLPRDD